MPEASGIYLEIMYSDRISPSGEFRQVRLPATFANASGMDKTGVLFAILSVETTPEKGRVQHSGVWYRRRFQCSNEDYYAFSFHENEVALWQWGYGQFRYISRANPDSDSIIKQDVPLHFLGADASFDYVVFTAPQVSLPESDWQEAIDQFEGYNGGSGMH